MTVRQTSSPRPVFLMVCVVSGGTASAVPFPISCQGPCADPGFALACEHEEHLGRLVLVRWNRIAALGKHFQARHHAGVGDAEIQEGREAVRALVRPVRPQAFWRQTEHRLPPPATTMTAASRVCYDRNTPVSQWSGPIRDGER